MSHTEQVKSCSLDVSYFRNLVRDNSYTNFLSSAMACCVHDEKTYSTPVSYMCVTCLSLAGLPILSFGQHAGMRTVGCKRGFTSYTY